MKSYEDHLKSLLSASPQSTCHRASSIFPVFHHAKMQMELLFLNYWQIKRKIDHLLCRFYLRDFRGNLVFKKCFYLDDPKAYRIKMTDILTARAPFSGSLEVEFCSPENLVFPYPAVVVYYKGPGFSTFVHSAQRTYNDSQDQKTNCREDAIESGFNIYFDEKTTPFLTFIQGSKPVNSIHLAAYNRDQEVIGATLPLKGLSYGTHYLSLGDWKELKDHLKGDAGCIKAKITDATSFPRLLVGNRCDSGLSVTHTYYDLVQSKSKSDYWTAPSSKWHAAALALPIKQLSKYRSRVYFYPIYTPCHFWVDLEVYSLRGERLCSFERVFEQGEDPCFQFVDADSFSEKLDRDQQYVFRWIAKGESSVPARIKIGFDVALRSKGLPCNICTNFYPANPSLDQKKKTFRWAPLMPFAQSGSIWCLNDAPKKNYKRSASVKLTFYRLKDAKKMEEQIQIPAHGAVEIKSSKKWDDFFEKEPGWCTLESPNPYITTYYFSEHSSGGIGGDHGF